VRPGAVTIPWYLKGLCLNVRWKVLYIAINIVLGAIVYARGVVGHAEYCVVPAGVIVLLGLHNPPRSWTGTWAPPLSRGIIAPCVDSLLCYGSFK
jgi:hypothetical protein